jgi:hypothetical protein
MSTFDTPPSICISHPGDVDSGPVVVVYGHCYVSYRIRFQVIIGGRVVKEAVQPFKLYMTSDIRPPLCPDDFPGEYHFSDRKTLSSLF